MERFQVIQAVVQGINFFLDILYFVAWKLRFVRQLTFLLSSQLCLQNTRGPQLNCKIGQIKPNFQMITFIMLLKIVKSFHKAVLHTFLKVFIRF